MKKLYYNSRITVTFHDIQLFAAFLFFLLIPLKTIGIIHYVIWLGVIAKVANIVSTMYNCGIKKEYVIAFIILLQIICSSLFTTNKPFISGLLYAIVCYFSIFWLIALSDSFSRSHESINTIYRFVICSGLLFTIYSFMPFAYYRDDNTISPTLTLYFGNSNLTGIYLFAVICIIVIYMKKAKKKIFVGLLIAYLMYLLWLTGARTCMIAAAFVIISSLFPIKFKIPKIIVIVCFLIPIVFVPVYLGLFKSGYADIMVMGKNLFSGRQGTFTDYLSLLHNNVQWIIGNLGEAGFGNAHNAPLTHLCSTGILGTLIFYGLMLMKTLKATEKKSEVARTALICMLGIFIQSSGEASIFLGGFPGVEFVYILFYLMNEEENI